MSESGQIVPSPDNIRHLVNKLKTLKDLQMTLDQKADIIKIGLLFERLKKLPKYIDWIDKIEQKLAEQDITFLSNSQLLKLLDMINKNIDSILRLVNELTGSTQPVYDNRKIEINIGTLQGFRELDSQSREKIRKLFDMILNELEKEDTDENQAQ